MGWYQLVFWVNNKIFNFLAFLISLAGDKQIDGNTWDIV